MGLVRRMTGLLCTIYRQSSLATEAYGYGLTMTSMISRRQTLAGIGSVTAIGLSGCGGYVNTTTGLVDTKSVVVWARGQHGEVMVTDLLSLNLNRETGYVYGRYDPVYFHPDTENFLVTVTEDRHRILTKAFEHVEYYALVVPGRESEPPAIGAVSRTAFDRLMIGGRATVGSYSDSDGRSRLRLHSTTARSQDVPGLRLRVFDIEDELDLDENGG